MKVCEKFDSLVALRSVRVQEQPWSDLALRLREARSDHGWNKIAIVCYNGAWMVKKELCFFSSEYYLNGISEKYIYHCHSKRSCTSC